MTLYILSWIRIVYFGGHVHTEHGYACLRIFVRIWPFEFCDKVPSVSAGLPSPTSSSTIFGNAFRPSTPLLISCIRGHLLYLRFTSSYIWWYYKWRHQYLTRFLKSYIFKGVCGFSLVKWCRAVLSLIFGLVKYRIWKCSLSIPGTTKHMESRKRVLFYSIFELVKK